jgi:RNA polymerase sigma factor (sigma-70 family)
VSSPTDAVQVADFGSPIELFSRHQRTNLGPTGEVGAMTPPEYFASGLPIVEDVIAFHSSRGRLSSEEREDFYSWAICKLIENDYGRIRKFEGRSSFRSFVSVIVGHLLVDYFESKGGRRRSSSTAQLFAPEGVWIERYLRRGHTLSEAIQLVRSNHDSPLSEDELYHIAIRLPLTRKRPTFVAESAGAQVGSLEASPERLIEGKVEEASRVELEAALERALARLSPEERVFVRMRFEEGSRINEIAQAFHIPEKAFYRRFQRTLRRLRKELRTAGLDARCLELYRDGGEPGANFRALAV